MPFDPVKDWYTYYQQRGCDRRFLIGSRMVVEIKTGNLGAWLERLTREAYGRSSGLSFCLDKRVTTVH